MFHFELEKSWFVHLDSWVWLRDPYFTSYFFLIWEQSFILHHQPPGEVLDFHPVTSISTFPSRWVLEPSRHFRRKPQRMKSKNIYLQSLRNPNTWLRANRSPCLHAWLINWFIIEVQSLHISPIYYSRPLFIIKWRDLTRLSLRFILSCIFDVLWSSDQMLNR